MHFIGLWPNDYIYCQIVAIYARNGETKNTKETYNFFPSLNNFRTDVIAYLKFFRLSHTASIFI